MIKSFSLRSRSCCIRGATHGPLLSSASEGRVGLPNPNHVGCNCAEFILDSRGSDLNYSGCECLPHQGVLDWKTSKRKWIVGFTTCPNLRKSIVDCDSKLYVIKYWLKGIQNYMPSTLVTTRLKKGEDVSIEFWVRKIGTQCITIITITASRHHRRSEGSCTNSLCTRVTPDHSAPDQSTQISHQQMTPQKTVSKAQGYLIVITLVLSHLT